MLATLRESPSFIALASLWGPVCGLAVWQFLGSYWGPVIAGATSIAIPIRLAVNRHVHQVAQGLVRPSYLTVFGGLFIWLLITAIASFGLAQQGDLRAAVFSALLVSGASGYVVSRWAAFPRFSGLGILLLLLALAGGFAKSPLLGLVEINWFTPLAVLSFFGLLSLNHKVISDALLIQLEHKRMSMHDALTDLPNRRALDERLSALCKALTHGGKQQASFAVLCLDLDGFKAVNDKMGHSAGDELLKKVAGRLLSVVRDGDLISRTGGDEFIVLLPNTNRDDAVNIAERVMSSINEPFGLHLGADVARVGTSIGIAIAPEHGREAMALLNAADSALYGAKHAGKSRWQLAQVEPASEQRPQTTAGSPVSLEE